MENNILEKTICSRKEREERQMRKQLLTFTLAITMIASSLSPVYAGATAKKDYITGKEYVKLLESHINVIKDTKKKKISLKGIKLGKKVSYTDACVLANRADILINGSEKDRKDAEDFFGMANMNNGLKDVTYEEEPTMTLNGFTRLYVSPKMVYNNIVKYKRIADLNKIPKAKRSAVISCYRKGIFVGDGSKVFQPSVKLGTNLYITKKQAKLIAKRVMGEEFVGTKWGADRREITPDGQIVRTKNLPKNADIFDYVVEGLPNWYYDTKFSWGEKQGTGIVYFPINMWRSSNTDTDNFEIQKYRFVLADRVKKSLEVRLNVDYRTVNDTWVKKASRIYHGEVGTEADKDWIDWINRVYLPNMKKNKVVIQSKKIVVDPWGFHRNKDGSLTFRCYAEFTTWGEKGAYEDQTDLFLCNKKTHLPILESGKPVNLMFDISIGHLHRAISTDDIKNYYPVLDSLSVNWEVIP